MANQVPKKQLQAWRDQSAKHGLSIPDADVIAEIKASAHARGIKNPIYYTKDGGGTLARMRQQGVYGVDNLLEITGPPASAAPAPKASVSAPDKPSVSTPEKAPVPTPASGVDDAAGKAAVSAVDDLPTPPAGSTGIKAGIKAGIKEGLKELVSPPNIAAEIPELLLQIADKFAVRDAIRNIQVKFIKEGFAKGVAAGVMRWTELELQALKNRVTTIRIEKLGDAAGHLKLSHMFKIAQAYENYAIDVGFQFTFSQTVGWNNDRLKEATGLLRKTRYAYPDDPRLFFEPEFIEMLAVMLKSTTDKIVGPAIRFD